MKRNPRQRKTHNGKNVPVRRQRTAGYLEPMVDSFSDVGRACRRYLAAKGELYEGWGYGNQGKLNDYAKH